MALPATVNHRILWAALLTLTALMPPMAHSEPFLGADQMIELPLEDLMQMDATVVSVSKRDEPLKDTPSAIYAITREDIHRASVTNIPDAIRMVPGVQVAQISTAEWAVSVRGLNGRYSRYLLVLIDGRSIYNPLLSGVNWDEQNLSLENIERIEVIRGPGGVMWGVNAVNGVINIITRAPEKTNTAAIRATAGNAQEAHSLYGRWDFATGNTGRAFVSAHTHKSGALSAHTPGLPSEDATDHRLDSGWQLKTEQSQIDVKLGFFDIDFMAPLNSFTFIAPTYTQVLENQERKQGTYLVLNSQYQQGNHQWHWRLSADDTKRKSTAYDWNTQNIDADIRWNGQLKNHTIVAGVSARETHSELNTHDSGVLISLNPPGQTSRTFSAYIQDAYSISDTVTATFGVRFDDYSITSSSVQPTLRLMWKPSETHRFWAGAARANSTPSRILHGDSEAPTLLLPPSQTAPLPQLLSFANNGTPVEDVSLTAYELGYRFLPDDRFNIDITAFSYQYDHLLGSGSSGEPQTRFAGTTPYIFIPLYSESNDQRHNWGAELSLMFRSSPHWLWHYASSYIEVDFKDDIENLSENFVLSDSVPSWQHSLRVFTKWGKNTTVDAWLRYVDKLEYTSIQSYWSLDMRIEQKINEQLEISFNGKNLIGDERVERVREIFNAGKYSVGRHAYLEIEWQF